MFYVVCVYFVFVVIVFFFLMFVNNYFVIVFFCGGSVVNFNLFFDGGVQFNVIVVFVDNICVRISLEDEKFIYEDDDYMFEGRSMG